jgi:hypothetical protein
MPHVLGNAGGPPPPTRNETLLREAVDRLRAELDGCRKTIEELRPFIDQHDGHVALPGTRLLRARDALDAYDRGDK